MKQLIHSSIIILALFFSTDLFSQLGFYAAYQQSDFKTWKEMVTDELEQGGDLLKHGFQVGVDYGFGLKTVRIDLYPGIFFRLSTSEQSSSSATNNINYFENSLSQLGLGLQANIYPLDLLSRQSMECPSFYRGAEKFTKGWFIAAKPSMIYSSKSGYFSNYLIEFIGKPVSKIIIDFTLGTGLDIGITKKISVTPYVMYGFSVGERWNGLSERFNQPSYNDTTQANHFFAGIRLGYWW
ncbi:MAG TPA: hypothetical protein PLU49_11805 [Saprospiraceae bacterium]|nr:hypothetical protein [Saprospiraceae bacterium]